MDLKTRQSTVKALRATARLLTADAAVDWGAVEKDIRQFNDIQKKLKQAKDDAQVQRTVQDRRVAGYLQGLITGKGSKRPLQVWLLANWPLLKDRKALREAERVMRESAEGLQKAVANPGKWGFDVPLTRWVKNLTDWMDAYARELNKFVSLVGPELFTYKGLRVANPERLPEPMVRGLLDGVDYVLMIFKKRGVEGVLDKTFESVVFRRNRPGEKSLGYYIPSLKRVEFLANSLTAKNPRMLKKWVHEVFLHEVGHHVHLSLLPTAAKKEWDKGWAGVEEAKKVDDEVTNVTQVDRKRFWAMLLKVKGDLRALKLKGLDRMKFHAWMRKPLLGGPLVAPKQLRWSKDGASSLQRFLMDPEGYFSDRYGPEDVPGEVARHWDRLEGKMGVDAGGTFAWPKLTEQEVEKYRTIDRGVDKAIDALEVPTQYARKDVMEDFAETFVAFIDAPEKLSPQAKFRMQRTLHLSNLHGKPIMKTVGKAETMDPKERQSAVKALRAAAQSLLTAGYYHLKQKKLSSGDLTKILERWVMSGEKVYETDQPVLAESRVLWNHREYTWTREKSRPGNARVGNKTVDLDGPMKWDALYEDMKSRGWDKSEPLHMHLGKNGQMKVAEGNHRLAIAQKLGLRFIPIMLHFQQQVKKSPSEEPMPDLTRKAVKKAVENMPVAEKKKLGPKEQEHIDDLMDLLGF